MSALVDVLIELARAEERELPREDVALDELVARAEETIDELQALGDERGLARAWAVRAWVPWFRCHARAAEAALEQAITHAARAGDARAEAQSVNLFVGAAVFGPAPVDGAILRCRRILANYPDRRRIAASAFRALAALVAMRGEFDEARGLLARDKEILRDLGLTVALAVSGEPAAMVEILADEPLEAERELRQGYEVLGELGESSSFSTFAALLARACYMQDKEDEALALTEQSERVAAVDDVSTHVQWRGTRAKILARRGRIDHAERLAREGVRLASKTDFLNIHGDALVDLAEILRIDARNAEAAAVVGRALRLYRAKGNRVSAERAVITLRALGAGDQATGEVATGS
jgi:tetratricopeptide (TPR) repeat protein